MSNAKDSTLQREFRCEHCDGLIRIPINLPHTTAPCPHCGKDVTSPGPEETETKSVKLKTEDKNIEFPSSEEEGSLAEQTVNQEGLSEEESFGEAEQARQTPFLPAAIAMICLVIIVAGMTAFLVISDRTKPEDDGGESGFEGELAKENNYIRTGWKKEAFDTLEAFIKATTVEGKMQYVLNPDRVKPAMEAFYGDEPIEDIDTPAEAFSIYNLPEADRREDMYMLVFDQPPQLDMCSFFRPVASLEVQFGLEKADLLLNSMAQLANFSMEPVRVHALFKLTEDGLKLDWEVFAQTKYRKLRDFIDSEEVGRSEIFRVFINEDVPKRGNISSDSRTYRVVDPANLNDSSRVKVLLDTKIANELAVLNWVGVQGAREYSRTATIELEWRPGEYEPYLSMKRFICWEYLGLGDKETPETEDEADSPSPSEVEEEDSPSPNEEEESGDGS